LRSDATKNRELILSVFVELVEFGEKTLPTMTDIVNESNLEEELFIAISATLATSSTSTLKRNTRGYVVPMSPNE